MWSITTRGVGESALVSKYLNFPIVDCIVVSRMIIFIKLHNDFLVAIVEGGRDGQHTEEGQASLRTFLNRQFRVSDLRFLDRATAQKVIGALRAIRRRKMWPAGNPSECR